MFIDEAKIYAKGGDGGKGCVSTHREIYAPHGGPDGGDGGRGGSVILRGSSDINTLIFFKRNIHFKGERGKHGSGDNRFGRDGEDKVIVVPLGTRAFESETKRFIGEIMQEGQTLVIAKGGRGGRGNAAFATANYRVPRFAEKGELGEERWVFLELRLMAHIGIVGFPNAGKSTLLAGVTRAKPKIADYPFTTLSPNLGVVEEKPGVRYIIADIPGLIEGASAGAGLGDRFLRHISRTKILIHMLDLTEVDPDNPLEKYNIINREMENYSASLIKKPVLTAANKTDITGTEEAYFAVKKALKENGGECFPISAATGEGTKELLKRAFEILEGLKGDFLSGADEQEDYVVIDENTENLSQFKIVRVEDYFVVKGKNPERMVQMTDLDNDEAVHHLQMRLQRMGVEEELKKLGIKNGDFVVIGNWEFNYYELPQYIPRD